MSQQTLEHPEALVLNNMTVYPNPTNPDLNNTRLWLRNALANVPYLHQDRVFRDVDATLAVFKALIPKTDIYAHDDGTVEVLLCLYGTIPITFRSTPYNIPVAFWIPTDYPMVPPIAFVVPTSNMLVKKSQHVDVSGRCSHPYLEHWNPPPHNEESNLVSLCSLLQNIFGQNPPVYTRPTSQPSPPAPPPPPPLLQQPVNGIQQHSPVLRAYSSTPPPLPPPPPYQPSSNMNVNRPRSHSSTIPPVLPTSRYATTSPLPTRSSSLHPQISNESQLSVPSILDTPPLPIITPSPAPLPTTQNPELVKLQSMVYDKVKHKCEEYVQKTSPELNRNMSIGEHLNQDQERIIEERKQLIEKDVRIREKTEILRGKIAEIDKLIEQAKNMPDVSVDDILCGTTIVYNQLFDLIAEDNAIEDATYYLGKALSSEKIDLNSYMKNIRTLAREQFMRRALIQKVRRQAGLDKINKP
ncbi:UEV-domain-containing protein [Rhizophagus irregularis]|uniref:UEV-domain-containing protein n=1 Tax=Rhizophagus irregularis TaxID=588596 RepID=A0A2I1FVT7_9GLOM|nr:UEV-domain-containing protein [Rhizophagus irregularis]